MILTLANGTYEARMLDYGKMFDRGYLKQLPIKHHAFIKLKKKKKLYIQYFNWKTNKQYM